MVSDKTIHKAFRTHEQNPLEKFVIFIIYLNYTLKTIWFPIKQLELFIDYLLFPADIEIPDLKNLRIFSNLQEDHGIRVN